MADHLSLPLRRARYLAEMLKGLPGGPPGTWGVTEFRDETIGEPFGSTHSRRVTISLVEDDPLVADEPRKPAERPGYVPAVRTATTEEKTSEPAPSPPEDGTVRMLIDVLDSVTEKHRALRADYLELRDALGADPSWDHVTTTDFARTLQELHLASPAEWTDDVSLLEDERRYWFLGRTDEEMIVAVGDYIRTWMHHHGPSLFYPVPIEEPPPV